MEKILNLKSHVIDILNFIDELILEVGEAILWEHYKDEASASYVYLLHNTNRFC